jgi:hypothetical protein
MFLLMFLFRFTFLFLLTVFLRLLFLVAGRLLLRDAGLALPLLEEALPPPLLPDGLASAQFKRENVICLEVLSYPLFVRFADTVCIDREGEKNPATMATTANFTANV